MEERDKKRICKKLAVKVDDHRGMILDLSKEGMKVNLSSLISQGPIGRLLRKRYINITFQIGGLILVLNCYVCWIRKQLTVYKQPQYQLGVSIQDPPTEYLRLVEKLLQ